MGVKKPKEVKRVFYGGTVAFLLIPSLTTQALQGVFHLSLSTSHTLKGISLPCAVVFYWTLVQLGLVCSGL